MYYYGIIVSYNGAVTFDREHKSSEQETNTTGEFKAKQTNLPCLFR